MPKAKKKLTSKRNTYSELMPIAHRIKVLRIKSGRSKEAFAADIDLSRTLYASYENGANITAINLLKIIRGLGISTREFFNVEDFE